jgi:hypothetical protein
MITCIHKLILQRTVANQRFTKRTVVSARSVAICLSAITLSAMMLDIRKIILLVMMTSIVTREPISLTSPKSYMMQKFRFVFLFEWFCCLGVSSILVGVNSFNINVAVGSVKRRWQYQQCPTRFNSLICDANGSSSNNIYGNDEVLFVVSRDERNTTAASSGVGVYRRIEDWHEDTHDQHHVIKHLKQEKAKWVKTFEDVGVDGI